MLSRFSRPGDRAALLLALLVLWAPLPAGSVTPGAELVFRLGALAAFLAGAVTPAPEWRRRRLLPAGALVGIALLGFVQSCGWPAGAEALVGEERARIQHEAAALTGADGGPRKLYLSLAPARSRSAALSWLAAAALLAAALLAGREPHARHGLAAALLAAALVQGVIGLARLDLSSPAGLAGMLLRPEGRLRGTFANPNHLSLFFEIAMAVAAAWLWWSTRRPAGAAARRWLPGLAAAGVWAALLALVVLTGSRVGLVAAIFGGAVQSLLLLAAGRGRRAGAVVGLVLVVGVGAVVTLASRVDIQRYATVSLFEDNLRGRLDVVPPALELWRRFPLTGTGLGTFEEAFPLVIRPPMAAVSWNRAHNDPLELLVTGGLVGLALGLACVVLLLRRLWRVFRYSASDEDRAAAVAAMGALSAVGLHELMDFGLVIPANGLAMAVVLGTAAGRLTRPAEAAAEPARG